MSFKDKATEMYNMLQQGKGEEAFEKFYAENVTMIEATGEVRESKDTNRKAQEQWRGMVKEFHGMGVNSITSSEADRSTMVETWVDVTFQNGHRNKMEQIARQKWNEAGQIEEERFYYDATGMRES